jgi:DNA-binding transcriptional LysR family regulator
VAEFDWNNLPAFLATARAGRLTAAAARLGVDHMTLSRRIGALEHSLKAKLFDRSPQGYTLTEQGQRLLPIAEEMERLSLAAHETVGGTAQSLSGSVRIGSPEGFGSYFLAPRISRLTERHPQLNIQLVATSAAFSLSKRDADLVIAVGKPPSGRLQATKLIDYDLALYAAPVYLDRHDGIATPADLKQHRFVSYIGDLLSYPELEVRDELAPGASAALESSNLVAQLKATRAGAGLCILPAFAVGAESGLVQVLPDAVRLTRSFWLVVHQDLAGLARVKTVARFIRDEVAAAEHLFKLA